MHMSIVTEVIKIRLDCKKECIGGSDQVHSVFTKSGFGSSMESKCTDFKFKIINVVIVKISIIGTCT